MDCLPTFLPPSSPDVTARRRLSALLRQFALRRCNGDQLVEWYGQVVQTSDDPTLQKLLDEHRFFILEADDWDVPVTWEDVRHNMRKTLFLGLDEAAPPLSKEERRVLVRWALFLRSEQVYRWPTWRGWALVCSNLKRLLMWLSFRLIRFEGVRDEDYGDVDVWPFLNRADYEAALKSPRLLCGKQAA